MSLSVSTERPLDGSVLVVCTGNVCRSPAIELLLGRELSDTRIQVASAGTGPVPDGPVDPRIVRIARLAGDAGRELGGPPRVVTRESVATADLVLTATRRQRGFVAALHPPALSYAFTLRDLADLAPHVTSPDPDAPDGDGSSPRTWVARIARAVARERGVVPPRADADADIVDPYRRPDDVYDEMVRQIRSALSPVVALLRGGAPRP